jgi:hypothetical protein
MRLAAAIAAALMLMGFAPQVIARTPNCSPGPDGTEFMTAYGKANAAIRDGRMGDVITLANALENMAETDMQRSGLASLRQQAYSGLGDHKGVLTETEKQIDIGCLSPEHLRIQKDLAALIRKDLGLPPR